MYTAQDIQRPQLDGFHYSERFTIGTGGHGDTAEIYKDTFHKQISMITIVERLHTGKQETIIKKGKECKKGIYYEHKYKAKRCTTIQSDDERDVYTISPLIAEEFMSIGLDKNTVIECHDLLKWKKDKDNNDYESIVGLSFSVGQYEARLINKKHVFLFKNKIVRTLRGRK